MSFKKFAMAGALAAAVAFPSVASASVTINAISGDPGFLTGRVKYSPGGIGGPGGPTSKDLYIGRIHMTGTDNTTLASVTFDSYCIDIFNYLTGGTFDLQDLALADATKQAQLQKLLGHTAGFIDAAGTVAAKKDISAAIQMAVWEIVNENGITGYSLGNGLFQIGTGYGTVVPSARGIAQGYLNDLDGWATPTGFDYRMMTALNPANNQRQVFLVPASLTPPGGVGGAVPEPSTWALLILGFGSIGGAMRRRRNVAVKFA